MKGFRSPIDVNVTVSLFFSKSPNDNRSPVTREGLVRDSYSLAGGFEFLKLEALCHELLRNTYNN